MNIKNKEQVNIAVVGCGGMARHYLSVYAELPWVNVRACVDIDLKTAMQAAEILQADIASIDFHAALSNNVDAVIINTPNHVHREQAVAAMEADKHVLLQKPVAATLADAEAIERAAERNDVISGIYMSYFDQPLLHDIRDLIKQHALGDVVHLYGRLMHKGGMISSAEARSGRRTWRTSLEETGGGCFIQLAVHYIQLFEWFTGSRVARATALTKNLHSAGIEGEDLACAVLELESGSLITLDTAWCTHGEQLAVHGTLGHVEYRNNHWFSMASSGGPYSGRVVDYAGGLITSFDGEHGLEYEAEIVPPAYGDASNPFNQQRMFLEAVRDGKPAFCSISSGVADLRAVQAVYESARTGRTTEVIFPLAETSR